jgi:hypothetical protein
MINYILSKLGYKFVYVSNFGIHDSIYDSIDSQALRPIHKNMSIAPTWAKRRIVKL